MSGPQAAWLVAADGSRRLHLQHGPIDLVIGAYGTEGDTARAYDKAWARFQDILPVLADELAELRRPLGAAPPLLRGPVARRSEQRRGGQGWVRPVGSRGGPVH